MRKGIFILLALIILAPVTAQSIWGYDASQELDEAANFIEVFLNSFSAELSSLSIAALAAVGFLIGLKRSKFKSSLGDDRGMNVIAIVIFITVFLMVRVTDMYIYFVPFMGFVMIVGLGVVLWGVYSGLSESKIEPWDKIMGAAGCFFLAWFAIMVGLLWVSVILGAAGVILLLMGLTGKELGDLWKGFRKSISRKDKTGSSPEDIISDDEIDETDAPPVTEENFDEIVKAVQTSVASMVNDLDKAQNELIKLLKELEP